MAYKEDAEIIRDRMLNNMSNTVDKREGYIAYDGAAALGKELSSNRSFLDQILAYAFPQTSSGTYLTYIANSHGVIRKIGQKATAAVAFTGTNNTSISSGTIVQTSSGLQYETAEDLTITNSTVSTVVIAVDIGTSYNVPANTITQSPIQIKGVTSVTNTAQAVGGTDDETDAELLKRLLEKVQNPPSSGNTGDYERWAKEISGVENCKVVPLWNGNGTVKLIISGINGTSLDSTIIQKVKDYIDPSDGMGDGTAPIGATITVITVTTLAINTAITGLTIKAGYELAAVQSKINSSLTSYLNSLLPGDTVKYNQIFAAITNTEGVSDFTLVKINDASSNIITTEEQKAVLGAITYN